MLPVIEKRLPEIERLCREHHVSRLELFGSAADGRFIEGESDLDFLVTFRPDALPSSGRWPDRDLSTALSDLFGMSVDVIEEKTIRNPYLRQGVDISPKALLYACPEAPPPPRAPVPHIMPECSLLELRTTKLLHDMHDTAREIIQMLDGKTPADYERDIVLNRAVKHSFLIIGEAAARLGRHNPETAARLACLRTAIDFRNEVAHEYDRLNTEKVWGYMERELPMIIRETGELLGER